MDQTAIQIEGLTKIYKLYGSPRDRLKEALNPFGRKYSRDFYALESINFEVKKGETVGIVGKNGAGKSTLLKIIAGVLTPSSGDVKINGRVASLLELGAGFNPEYTGLENIYFQGSIMGLTRKQMDERVDSIRSFADIGEFIHQPVQIYSSGMFARLAFSIAINVEPEILIVDEALSVGDIAFQAKCFRKFEALRENGVTILFVSHSIEQIIKTCHRAFLIDGGKIAAEGDPKFVVDEFKKTLVSLRPDLPDGPRPGALSIEEHLSARLPKAEGATIYGNNSSEIYDYALLDHQGRVTNHLSHGEEFSVVIRARANRFIQNPILAYAIKDAQGLELTGTNTVKEMQVIEAVSEGERYSVTFTQKMFLAPGQYLLSIGNVCYQNDELVVFHRMYDIVPIVVSGHKYGTGICYVDTRTEFLRM